MENLNHQLNTWVSNFGKEYTDRNTFDDNELEQEYVKEFGIKRSIMNELFLKDIDLKNKKVLEVGCNIGNQLGLLKKMGYQNLFGIDVQNYAIQNAIQRHQGINFLVAEAENLPFKDSYFEMVFTSGVLIHISPENITKVMEEIYRCARKYIWGFEYFSEDYKEVNYRGNDNILWKTDFPKLFKEKYSNLELLRLEKYKYISSDNVDIMYIFEKK